MLVEDSSEGLFNLPLLAYAHKKMLGNFLHFLFPKKTQNIKPEAKKRMSLYVCYQKIKANYTESKNNKKKDLSEFGCVNEKN